MEQPAPPSSFPNPPMLQPRRKPRGFLNPTKVRAFAFYVISLCILVSVVASIFAIWEFAGKDALIRTIATCVVVAGGCAVFAVVNVSFGSPQDAA